MKSFKLILLFLLISAVGYGQTTPWSGTPVVTPQTRQFNGAPQIRFIWSPTNIFSLVDSLNARVLNQTANVQPGGFNLSGNGSLGKLIVNSNSTQAIRVFDGSANTIFQLNQNGGTYLTNSSGSVSFAINSTSLGNGALSVTGSTSGNSTYAAQFFKANNDRLLSLRDDGHAFFGDYAPVKLPALSASPGSASLFNGDIWYNSTAAAYYVRMGNLTRKLITSDTTNTDSITRNPDNLYYLTNKTTARANLGVYSSAQTDAKYVPYTGATSSVNLGSQTLTTTGVISNGLTGMNLYSLSKNPYFGNFHFISDGTVPGDYSAAIEFSTYGTNPITLKYNPATSSTARLTLGGGGYAGISDNRVAVVGDLSAYVPYTGATTDVALGSHSLTANYASISTDILANRVITSAAISAGTSVSAPSFGFTGSISGPSYKFTQGSFDNTISASALTAFRTQQLQDKNGVLALLSDITPDTTFLRTTANSYTLAQLQTKFSSLPALTTGDGSLTFSGAYNTSVARTVSLNTGNANTWTALQSFSGTTTQLQLQNGTSTASFALQSSGQLQISSSPSTAVALANGFTSSTAASVSNIYAVSTGAVNMTTAQMLFPGATTVSARIFERGNTSAAPATGTYYEGHVIGAQDLTLPTGGTIPWSSSLTVLANTFSGTGTATNAATLMIATPTGATNNYSALFYTTGANNAWFKYGVMRVSGLRVDSGLYVKGLTSGTVSILPQSAAGTYNFNLPTTAGTAGQVLTSQGGVSTAMAWTSVQPQRVVSTITGATTIPTLGALDDYTYYTNNTTQVVVTLPASCAVGARIYIAGQGSGGWKIAQQAGDIIFITGGSTTTGTAGSVTSANAANAILVTCRKANTGSGGEYLVQSVQGSPSYN